MTKIEIDIDKITTYHDELKDTKARLKFELDAVEKEIEKNEIKLIALLSEMKVDSFDYGVYSFGLKTVKRTAFSQKEFSKDNPELFEKYKLTNESVKFEFRINK